MHGKHPFVVVVKPPSPTYNRPVYCTTDKTGSVYEKTGGGASNTPSSVADTMYETDDARRKNGTPSPLIQLYPARPEQASLPLSRHKKKTHIRPPSFTSRTKKESSRHHLDALLSHMLEPTELPTSSREPSPPTTRPVSKA